MFFEAKVTKIYCLADDFCKEFAKHQEYYMLKEVKKDLKHHNKSNRMSDAEITYHDYFSSERIPMLQALLSGIRMQAFGSSIP